MGGEGDKLELDGHQLHSREHGRETNSFKKLFCCCQMLSACFYFRNLLPSADYLNTLWFLLSPLCCVKDVAKISSDHLKGWPWMWLTFCVLLTFKFTVITANQPCHLPSTVSGSTAAVRHVAEPSPCAQHRAGMLSRTFAVH